jgi:surfactin synthase thioesterase subunit
MAGAAAAKLRTPVVVVCAADDPDVAEIRRSWPQWRTVAERVRYVEVPGGGHQFVRSRPESAATLIDQEW